MENYIMQSGHLIVKYIGPSDYYNPYIKVKNEYFKKSFKISWNHNHGSDLFEQVLGFLNAKSIKVIARSELKDAQIVLIDWEDCKKLFNI